MGNATCNRCGSGIGPFIDGTCAYCRVCGTGTRQFPRHAIVAAAKAFAAQLPDCFRAEAFVACLFCANAGALRIFTYGSHLSEDGNAGGVGHEQPMCSEFRDLEPDEFLRAARLALTLEVN